MDPDQTSLRIRAVWSGSMLFAISFSTCYRVCKRTAWILIRLRGCAGWSGSILVANPLCWFCRDAAHLFCKHLFVYVSVKIQTMILLKSVSSRILLILKTYTSTLQLSYQIYKQNKIFLNFKKKNVVYILVLGDLSLSVMSLPISSAYYSKSW
jgi:hypothetical protein